jgi:hypothetical protein
MSLHAEIDIHLNKAAIDPQLSRYYMACMAEMAGLVKHLAQEPKPEPSGSDNL